MRGSVQAALVLHYLLFALFDNNTNANSIVEAVLAICTLILFIQTNNLERTHRFTAVSTNCKTSVV